MELNVRRVAVIGAGVAGLASVKTCLEGGLEPVCFEKSDKIGGVWVIPDKEKTDPRGSASVYEGMITNVTKEIMCYSDFPFPRELPPFLKVPEVLQYYDDYATNFDLLRHIRFETEVLEVKQTEDFKDTGKWKIRSRQGGQEKTETFDAVMVCTGMYSSGYVPEDPGCDRFTGRIMHSCQFRRAEDFKDKTVVVVGGCHSAGDMAVLCSDRAKKVVLSMRDGAWIVPRIWGTKTADTLFNQRWKDAMPPWLVAPAVKKKLESLMDPVGLGVWCSRPPINSLPMVNGALPLKIMSGTVGIKSGIRRIEGSKVIFEDGSEMADVDCVIYATGYRISTPFLDDRILSNDFKTLDLYLHCIPPRLERPTLAAIGLIATRGSTSSTSELQAQLAIQIFRGKVQLPSEPEMMSDIRRNRDSRYRQYGTYRPLIVPTRYNDELARVIGALPNIWTLFFTDPKLAFQLYFGTAYPECYRLVGPFAKSDARENYLRSAEDLLHGITLTTVRPDAQKKFELTSKSEGGRNRLPIVFVVICALTFIYLVLLA